MSQSPVDPSHATLGSPYGRGWQTMARLLAEGWSWSGHERKCCFLNTGGPRFANVSAISGLDLVDDGRAVAVVDWDLDGDLDLWMSNRSSPAIRYFRNDMATGNHFLDVRLAGRTCNRDAIGARVEVIFAGGIEPPQIKSLRAGEGFMAQSSKWVHFGLGLRDRIEKVIVRWPGGPVEDFAGLLADRRYELVQGSGAAVEWSSPRSIDEVQLPENEVTIPPSASSARIVLFRPRLPQLPDFDFAHFDRRMGKLHEGPRRPRLVLLWASWCSPCLAELAAFTSAAGQLRASGVELLALDVDALDREHGAAPDEVQRILERQQFPFPAGHATPSAVTALENLNTDVTGKIESLPVPTSVLLDADNRVVVVYKGRVSPQQVLEDVKLIGADPDVVRTTSVPFPGRWSQDMGSMYEDHITMKGIVSALVDNPQHSIPGGAAAFLLVLAIVLMRRRRAAREVPPARQ